jgi:cell division transport system permease protein
VLSTFLIIFLNLQTCLDKWNNQIQVTAYLADKITPEELILIKQKTRSFHEVKKLSFISKEEALSFFKDTFPGQKQVLEGLKKNPLPASINIQLKDGYHSPDKVRNFALQVKNIPGVDEVEYGQSWIEGYASFLNFIKLTTLTLGVVILLATVFIISNTIKLTVYARKEEIEIMRLVGATNLFIKTPFFIEGILQGFLGAFTALVTLHICHYLFSNWIVQSSYLPLQSIQISYLPPHYLVFITAGGMLTGFLGSFFSLGRYLKI